MNKFNFQIYDPLLCFISNSFQKLRQAAEKILKDFGKLQNCTKTTFVIDRDFSACFNGQKSDEIPWKNIYSNKELVSPGFDFKFFDKNR